MSKIILSEQASQPTTPSVGKATFYVGSDGRARLINDDGVVRILENREGHAVQPGKRADLAGLVLAIGVDAD